MWGVVSCAAVSGPARDALEDQLQAENRLIKKNSELALRENEVLKTENANCRSEVKKLHEVLQQIQADLDALNQKYAQDMEKANEAYQNLCEHFSALEMESDKKIRTLTESNASLEKKLSDEASRFNQLLKEQKDAFLSEKNMLQTEYEEKIKTLEIQLALFRKESEEKKQHIELLEKNKQDDQTKINNLEKTIKEFKDLIEQNEHQFQELMSAHQRLQNDNQEKQIIIDQLNEKLKSLEPSVRPSAVP